MDGAHQAVYGRLKALSLPPNSRATGVDGRGTWGSSDPLRSPYSDVLTSGCNHTRNFPDLAHGSPGVDGRGTEEALGTTRSPPPVGATTRDWQWSVCRDMIRGGSNGLRAHFTRATCPAHHHIGLPAAAAGTDEPGAPIEHLR
jgi:hypothetical protein